MAAGMGCDCRASTNDHKMGLLSFLRCGLLGMDAWKISKLWALNHYIKSSSQFSSLSWLLAPAMFSSENSSSYA